MQNVTGKSLAGLVTAFVATVGMAGQLPEYQAELLGPASDVRGMNAHGDIVGGYSPVFSDVMRAYVAGPNHAHELLPLPEGFTRSWAHDINDDGVIVGGVTDLGFPSEHGEPAVWTPNADGGYDVQVLDHLTGHVGGLAKGINNRGDIIGQSFFTTGLGPGVWFNSPDGVMSISAMGAPSTLEDINDEGIVVGFNGSLFDIDTLESMPLPSGTLGLTGLYAINNANELAGAYGTSSSHGAVRWTDQFGWELVGQAGGQSSPLWAWDINENGDTVADVFGVAPLGSLSVAVHTDEFGTLDLESLIASDQGNWGIFTLTRAAINDAGQIGVIAENFDTGEYGVVVLTPTTTESTGDMDGDGVVGPTDLAMLLGAWGSCDPRADCPADLNGDGTVGAADLALLLGGWG